MPDARPNILLLMSDQHNPHVIGCAGDDVVQTPALDALASNGVTFSQTYCNHPLCGPSRMSFMTGRYSSDTDVWTNSCPLSSDVPTFAHHLAAAGYETTLCGRMHFIGPDQRHGFGQRLIGDVNSNLVPEPIMRAQGQYLYSLQHAGAGRTGYLSYDEAVTDRCVEYLRDRCDGRPMLLTVGLYQPHCPFICPRDLFDYYYDRVEVPVLPPGYLESLHPAMRQWRERRGVDEATDENMRTSRAGYYGLVTFLDRCIGRITEALAAAQMNENTVVIYTSDHGDMAGEHCMWWKSSFYEGSLGVPLIASWPQRYACGITVNRPCSLIDIAPTLLEIADAQPLNLPRGNSLVPFLEGAPADSVDWPDTVLADRAGAWQDPVARMFRRGPWKMTCHHGYDRVQLFNPEGRYVQKFLGDASLSKVSREYMLTNASPNRMRDMADLEPQKYLRRPTSVVVDGEGTMFVADNGSYRLQVYRKEAIRLTSEQFAPPRRAPTLQQE